MTTALPQYTDATQSRPQCVVGFSGSNEPLQASESIERVNRWIPCLQTIVLTVQTAAIVAGVIFAVFQLSEISRQTSIQSDTLKTTQRAQSADLVLKFSDKLETSRYDKITDAIRNHDQRYHLLSRSNGGKGGAFRDIDVERYIGNFDPTSTVTAGSAPVSD